MCKSFCFIKIREKATSKSKHYEMVALKLALAIWLVRIELDWSYTELFFCGLWYKGQLISNVHSQIFCQRSKVAMRAQCVLVATTLLHSDTKFHSFLYTGSKTVRVSMEPCYGGMSTRLKQHAVTEFLSAENVTPAEIHCRLQAVYGENTVNRTTVNRWAIKFREFVMPILLTNLAVEGRFP